MECCASSVGDGSTGRKREVPVLEPLPLECNRSCGDIPVSDYEINIIVTPALDCMTVPSFSNRRINILSSFLMQLQETTHRHPSEVFRLKNGSPLSNSLKTVQVRRT